MSDPREIRRASEVASAMSAAVKAPCKPCEAIRKLLGLKPYGSVEEQRRTHRCHRCGASYSTLSQKAYGVCPACERGLIGS